MKLTQNFMLDEFIVSQTAARFDIDNTPSQYHIDNLRRLCETILQPLRDEIGAPIVVTSGYRSERVNTIVGGSLTSAHMDGRAADVTSPGVRALDLCLILRELQLPFDQIINEFGAWCHIGIAREGEEPRRQCLTAKRGTRGRVYYTNDLV